MYDTLYRKYRPQKFDEFTGNEYLLKSIKNSLIGSRMSHSYLFTGPRGVGKTSLARLIAKSINCSNRTDNYEPCDECQSCKSIKNGNFLDVIEIDGASNRGIDEARELKDKVNYKPVHGNKKIYIIDEVHMMTKEAFNALLKTLEEPPEHVLFILATTEVEKLPDTIVSRCQRYDFSLVSEADVVRRLRKISDAEKIAVDDESLKFIFSKGGGSLRDSVSILEKLNACYFSKEITLEMTEKALGFVPSSTHSEFLNCIQGNDLIAATQFIERLWHEGLKLDSFLKDFASYVKDEAIENRFSLDYALFVMDTILTVLNKFKNEDDKRILAYIAINRLISPNIKSKTIDAVKVLDDKISVVNSLPIAPKFEKAKHAGIVEPDNSISEQKAKDSAKKMNEVEKVKIAIEDLEKELMDKKAAEALKKEKQLNESKVSEKEKFVIFGDEAAEIISKSWPNILARLKDKKISLMIFCSAIEKFDIKDGLLMLGFDTENSFSKSALEKLENLVLLKQAVREELNMDLNVKCYFTNVLEDENASKESEVTFLDKVKELFQGEIIELDQVTTEN